LSSTSAALGIGNIQLLTEYEFPINFNNDGFFFSVECKQEVIFELIIADVRVGHPSETFCIPGVELV
jgi:hypothetical protein